MVLCVQLLAMARYELLLFAAVGLFLGGLDELAIDLLWMARWLWRRITVYSRHPRASMATLPTSPQPGAMAVFIPAWDEAAVIGPMLGHALAQWQGEDCILFVGCYPNDAATLNIVADIAFADARVLPVITDRDGPTTKAHCLNALWRAMRRHERANAMGFKGVVLHDAEDVVHADELRLFDYLLDRFALVQTPVLPLPDPTSRWVGGHYLDEFAESHTRAMIVREALGAALPSAGVGCAFSRDVMGRIAERMDGAPFDAQSLTEDYELGMRVRELGGVGVMVHIRDAAGGLVCTREYFPTTLPDAVRQKTRWTIGISLAGWDRIGWSGGAMERWMRLRDRRAPLAAMVLTAAYLGAILQTVLTVAARFGLPGSAINDPLLAGLIAVTFPLLIWRLVWRVAFVAFHYGWIEGVRAVPRAFLGNIIAIMAAWRAMAIYLRMWRGEPPRWDKTRHRFPDMRHGEAA